MIMARGRLSVENRVREHRLRRGWSQEELSRLSGLSRAGVSAIEIDRLVPSAAAALALAAAFGCRVEDLFVLARPAPEGAAWAWGPGRTPCRYWHAEVAGRVRLFPVEATPLGVVPHDGIAREAGAAPVEPGGEDPKATLVVACCDPAVGLLAAELARTSGVRLLAFQRPSRAALELLRQRLVHVAGVHLTRADRPEGNAEVVRAELGPGYSVIRVARWEEGIAVAPGLRVPSVRDAVRAGLRWVGRQDGSGARQCLDELLGRRRVPRRVVSDHRGVAEAVRNGWADAGVCLRLVSEEAGLDFLGVREEAYDLCFPSPWKNDPRIQALLDALRAPSYRKALGELPGYNSADTGEMHSM
jgi:molybdate-binding protein/transcriptional regulator with XRE-family HTH domain